ncbi:MAG: hypothetical protein II007_00355 [Gammaproteobacteria bacterium]|nr:hypothetical protein [Gammaproteobacteria bacterium]
MFLFNWWSGDHKEDLSAKQALKLLLKERYRSTAEYDQYLALVEEQTGHPDVEALLADARQRGIKAGELLRQLEADVGLLDALTGHPHGHNRP